MSVLAWHFNNSLVDRRVIARSVAQRRLLARSVIRIGDEHGLAAFRCSGTHLHYLLFCDRPRAGRFLQRVNESLRRGLGLPVGFSQAYGKAVDSQRYLRTAFSYVVGNTAKHEIDYDPLHEASVLPDLLGMRVLGAEAPRIVRESLPGVNRRKLLGYFGISALEPADDARWIVEAAAAALALPGLGEGGRDGLRARCVAAHLVGSRLADAELSSLMEVSTRSLRRLRLREPEPGLLHAVGLQVALRRGHAARLAARQDPLLASEDGGSYGVPEQAAEPPPSGVDA